MSKEKMKELRIRETERELDQYLKEELNTLGEDYGYDDLAEDIADDKTNPNYKDAYSRTDDIIKRYPNTLNRLKD